jgi:hypothetical protein
MIIVCKHTLIPGSISTQYVNLTIGKNYTALTDMNDSDIMVELVDDSYDRCWYPKSNFYILQLYRDYKLKKLGI